MHIELTGVVKWRRFALPRQSATKKAKRSSPCRTLAEAKIGILCELDVNTCAIVSRFLDEKPVIGVLKVDHMAADATGECISMASQATDFSVACLQLSQVIKSAVRSAVLSGMAKPVGMTLFYISPFVV